MDAYKSLKLVQPERLALPPKIIAQDHGLRHARRKSPPAIVIFHHTATPTPKRTISALKSSGASTHYEIDRDGTIYQYLDPARHVAWHCVARNDISIGVDLTHPTGAPFSDAQILSACALLVHLCRTFSIAPAYDGGRFYKIIDGGIINFPLQKATVYGHGQLRPTQCPDGLDVGAIAGGAFRALSTRDL